MYPVTPNLAKLPLCLFVSSVALAWCWNGQAVRAEDGAAVPVDLRARLDAGAGMHESSLPGAGGTRRVAAAWFPAAGFRFSLAQRPGARLRFGGELAYTSSVGYELTRSIEPDTTERSGARAQEFAAAASMAIALMNGPAPISLPITLGYGGTALSTDTPLAAAQAYLITGPRAGVGIDLPLFAGVLDVSARGEVGINLTATQALQDSGAGAFGWTYGFQVAADVRLAGALQIGVRYREAHAALPLSGTSAFHEIHRFALACLTLRNPR